MTSPGWSKNTWPCCIGDLADIDLFLLFCIGSLSSALPQADLDNLPVADQSRKYLPGQQNKELIVVHNLRMTDQILEALELFERQITRCYEGGSSHMGRLLFTAELGESAPPVHHIGLCQEGTKAGNNFNKPNFDYLMRLCRIIAAGMSQNLVIMSASSGRTGVVHPKSQPHPALFY